MAANNDGVWDPNPVSLSFTILAPIWQTAWFRIIGAIAIVSLIYLIFWWRLKSIKTQKAKLEKRINAKTLELQKFGRRLMPSLDLLTFLKIRG